MKQLEEVTRKKTKYKKMYQNLARKYQNLQHNYQGRMDSGRDWL